MSLRVALFASSLRGGGAERAMLDIARGLSQCGLAVDLVLVKATGPYLDLVPSDVRLIDLDSRRAALCVPRFVRYLRRERPAVLISTSPEINVIAVLARALFARAMALALRRTSTFTMEWKHGRCKQRVVLRLERLLLRLADAVITNSRGAADDLVGVAPNLARLTRAIHNPVIWPDLAVRASEPVNHPWFLDPSTPVVLATGRLVPVKDYPTLLRVFANVVLHSCSARLIVLGEGPERSALECLAENLGIDGSVDFPGFVRNPFSYMSKASVFVLSSLYEGSPNALIQAMACGTPVVSTDCPNGPREILRDGELGRLVPVGDCQALGEAILDTLDTSVESARLIEGTSEYSAEKSIRQYFNLVHELAERGRPARR